MGRWTGTGEIKLYPPDKEYPRGYYKMDGHYEMDEYDSMAVDIACKHKKQDKTQELSDYLRSLAGKHPDHIKQLGIQWIKQC